MLNVIDMNSMAAGKWLVGEEAGAAFSIRRIDAPTRAASGTLSTAPFDRFFYVVVGRIAVELGEASIDLADNGFVFVPADTPFRWQAKQNSSILEFAAAGGPVLHLPLRPAAPTHLDRAESLVIQVDDSRFGEGFATQILANRASGSQHLRLNVIQVQPGKGSPDYHIHMFDQFYVILEGEMTLNIGRKRLTAPKGSLVVLPAGVVHRNVNAGSAVERHISVLIPEPQPGEILDYAVDIHEREAKFLAEVPAALA